MLQAPKGVLLCSGKQGMKESRPQRFVHGHPTLGFRLHAMIQHSGEDTHQDLVAGFAIEAHSIFLAEQQ